MSRAMRRLVRIAHEHRDTRIVYKIQPTRGTSLFVASIVVLIELNALDPPLSHALTARGLSYLFATLNSRLVIEISYDRPANIHFYSLGLFFCCYSL